MKAATGLKGSRPGVLLQAREQKGGQATATRAEAAMESPVQAGTHTLPAADLQIGLRPQDLAGLLDTAKPVMQPILARCSLFWTSVFPSLKWDIPIFGDIMRAVVRTELVNMWKHLPECLVYRKPATAISLCDLVYLTS